MEDLQIIEYNGFHCQVQVLTKEEHIDEGYKGVILDLDDFFMIETLTVVGLINVFHFKVDEYLKKKVITI